MYFMSKTMKAILKTGTYNFAPTVSNHGGCRVGNKTHKVWIVKGDFSPVTFFRKKDAVMFINEFLPENPSANPNNMGGAFEGWLAQNVRDFAAIGVAAKNQDDRAAAMDRAQFWMDIVEGVRFL